MKLRIILSAMLVIMITAGLNTKANAEPWRGRHWRHEERYCPPVRVYVPPVTYGYCAPAYCPPVRYVPRYYHEHEYREYRRGYRR